MKKLILLLALAAGALLSTSAAPALANNCSLTPQAPSVVWGGTVWDATGITCDHAYYVKYQDVLTDGFGSYFYSLWSPVYGPRAANITGDYIAADQGCPLSANRYWKHYMNFQIKWVGNQSFGPVDSTVWSPVNYYACK